MDIYNYVEVKIKLEKNINLLVVDKDIKEDKLYTNLSDMMEDEPTDDLKMIGITWFNNPSINNLGTLKITNNIENKDLNEYSIILSDTELKLNDGIMESILEFCPKFNKKYYSYSIG